MAGVRHYGAGQLLSVRALLETDESVGPGAGRLHAIARSTAPNAPASRDGRRRVQYHSTAGYVPDPRMAPRIDPWQASEEDLRLQRLQEEAKDEVCMRLFYLLTAHRAP